MDCVFARSFFEKSCALYSAQVNWKLYHRPWFVGALGAPGSTLACLMPSVWDRSPFCDRSGGQSDRRAKTSPRSESEVHAYPQQDAPPLSTPTSTAITTLFRMRLIGYSCSEPLSRECFHHRDCLHDEGSHRTMFHGLIELQACPAQKVCDCIPYSRSKWSSRPQWPEVYRHRALLTDAFVASRGCLLTQSDGHRCLLSSRAQPAYCPHGGR